ncbi:MAG TPA: RidA family protein [Alphaproteobacteria bacterium]|jgi:enamine deaminase RidA (YjgF/YER057c/UK114 family)|nr:RidA family protein [Alphaproteobacteria bacterium]
MSHEIDARLAAQGIQLPSPAAPAANYVPFVLEGGLLTISGQLPIENGAVAVTGKLGGGVSVTDGERAARLCAVNILAQAQAALGDLGRIRRCVRLGGFVASTPDFVEQHLVVNGASNLIADVLGGAGKHARAAVGVPSLPRDAAVEVEALFAVD